MERAEEAAVYVTTVTNQTNLEGSVDQSVWKVVGQVESAVLQECVLAKMG